MLNDGDVVAAREIRDDVVLFVAARVTVPLRVAGCVARATELLAVRAVPPVVRLVVPRDIFVFVVPRDTVVRCAVVEREVVVRAEASFVRDDTTPVSVRVVAVFSGIFVVFRAIAFVVRTAASVTPM